MISCSHSWKNICGLGWVLPTLLPARRSAMAVTKLEEEAGSSDKGAGAQGWTLRL